MLCCLCIKEISSTKEAQQLYYGDGKKSAVFQTTQKYFQTQLDYLETCSEAKSMLAQIVCNACWQNISAFDEFQQSIIAAHLNFVSRIEAGLLEELKYEPWPVTAPDFVKIEDEIPINSNGLSSPTETPIISDFVKIELQQDVLHIDNNFNSSHLSDTDEDEDEDDKPLITRLRSSSKSQSTKVKMKKSVTKKRTKKSKEEPKPEPELSELKQDDSLSESARQKKEQDDFILEHWRQNMKCGLCEELCENFAKIRVHFRAVHNNPKGFVLCCGRKYFHRYHLVDHLQMHINPEYFKCSECGKCLSNRRNLRTHIKEAHRPQPLERSHECMICHKKFAKAAILKGHMDIHAEGNKDYVCNVCGKGFVLKHRLAIHVRNVHETTGGGVCDQCGKSFKDRYSLRRHLLEHAGVTREKWPCDQCSSQLHSKFSLRRHKRLAHHDGSTVYRCGECGKVALTEDALRSHKKYVHERQRIFKCNICNKAFKVALVLKEHMTTHTGEDLYKCPHCPKTFKVCANMHHHRKRVHPKEWAETRQHRTLASHTDLSGAANEVVM